MLISQYINKLYKKTVQSVPLCPSHRLINRNHFRESVSKRQFYISSRPALDLAVAKVEIPPYDLQKYTGGSWVQNDSIQRTSRFIKFDYNQLCQRVLEIFPAAHTVQHCKKVDGGFNRVLLLTLDNGQKVVARLPTVASGPERLITNSEVATISFLKRYTNIPVPRVLDWSDDPTNVIGAEYIIMDYIGSIRLQERWATMNAVEHLKCTKALCDIIADMSKIQFPAYGSLYFTNAMSSGIPIEQSPEFCIGPHCGADFWNCDPYERSRYGNSNQDHGPWRTLEEYCQGLFAAAKSRIPLGVDVGPSLRRETAQEHLQLLDMSTKIIGQLILEPKIQSAAIPMLLHPDFHKRNIFVSDENPAVITGIIDWQSAAVEPAFTYLLEQPDFALCPSSQDEKDGQENETAKQDRLICYQAYDIVMKGFALRLQAARAVHETLLRPFHFCYLSTRIGAAAVREDLIELSRDWNKLGLAGQSPYSPSAEEVAEHQRQFQEYQDARNFKGGVMRMFGIASDGWVQEDRWEHVEANYKGAFELHMETFREGEAAGEESVTEDLGRRLWPWKM